MADDRSTLGPDAIWAPWRLAYLEDAAATEPRADASDPPAPTSAGAATAGDDRGTGHALSSIPGPAAPESPANPLGLRPPTGCFLTDYWLEPARDREHHVVERTGEGLILLNAYPYSNGHLLVALGLPRPRLLDYTPAERGALWALVDRAVDLMERTLEPQGINVGVNQGRAAGAGVPQHLHVHVVPRWNGDVNFMTAVGRIRVVPGALDQMAARYRTVASRG